jgi:hypothetical protein
MFRNTASIVFGLFQKIHDLGLMNHGIRFIVLFACLTVTSQQAFSQDNDEWLVETAYLGLFPRDKCKLVLRATYEDGYHGRLGRYHESTPTLSILLLFRAN